MMTAKMDGGRRTRDKYHDDCLERRAGGLHGVCGESGSRGCPAQAGISFALYVEGASRALALITMVQ